MSMVAGVVQECRAGGAILVKTFVASQQACCSGRESAGHILSVFQLRIEGISHYSIQSTLQQTCQAVHVIVSW